MVLNRTRRDILETIEALLEPRRNRYVADHEIAERLGLTLQQVRDYLNLLKQTGYVDLAKNHDGHAALTTWRGRLALQDPESIASEAQRSTIVLSGDFQNAILNIDSTLTNLGQTINAVTGVNPDVIGEMERLVEQLNETLKQAPSEKMEEAEAVAQAAEVLIEAATNERPNKYTVEIRREGLQKAAQNIASVMPTVIAIATQIIAAIAKLQANT